MVRNQRDFRTSAWSATAYDVNRVMNANGALGDIADNACTLIDDLIACGLITGSSSTGDRSFPDEWTVVNDNTDRSIDANGALAVIGDGFATLIRDLKENGSLTNRNIRDAPLRNWVTANNTTFRSVSGLSATSTLGDILTTLIMDLGTLNIINDTT